MALLPFRGWGAYMNITINFTGGIVSPGYLKDILETATACGVEDVSFGRRQQLKMELPAKHTALFNKLCAEKNIQFYKAGEVLPNIVSSYPAANIFTADTWLKEGVYKDIFYALDHTPQLKINVCDSSQSFVPFFTGHINWIASPNLHYWYLYIRFPKTHTVYCWPELIYTNDVAQVSKQIEALLLQDHKTFYANDKADGKQLFTSFKQKHTYISKSIETELVLPKFYLPYYEGFNKVDNHYWLGIYRRDELFPVSFLMNVCDICLETKIGQLYTTPWKSIIVKGIEQTNRILWDRVLGKYRINVRHAANELNWQVGDTGEEGLVLKRHIVRYFDKEDVRTYGLSFAVQIYASSSMFGSVIIRKQQNKNPHKLKSLERFDILYNPDFNPNSDELIMYRDGVEKDHIGTYLVSLCKLFYSHESDVDAVYTVNPQPAIHITPEKNTRIIHQCTHCFTVYNEVKGDAENNIAAGTSFNDLPSSYHCPLCDADKKDFVEVEESSLLLQV